MAAKIFLSAMVAAVMTVVGSRWIDKLYGTSTELSFPDDVVARAKFRKPILFCTLTVMNFVVLSTATENFFATEIFFVTEIFFGAENFFLAAGIFLLTLMTVTDFEQYMLFDVMTGALALVGAVRVWLMNLSVADCAAAAFIGGGIFFALAMLSRDGLGGGDVKLVAALGIWFGCQKLLDVVLLATVSGGLVALTMILTKQKDRGSYFAYGPYFALASIYFLLTG